MQAVYPKKLNSTKWDPVNVEYPVRKFPDTGVSSETASRQWRGQPEVIRSLKRPIDEIREYYRDYNLTKDLTQSLSTVDLEFKHPETQRFNKHTSCTENHYIYPPSRKLADRPPQCTAHGTTEMRHSYTIPTIPARLVTEKDQYKDPRFFPEPPILEPSWHKELEPLDTTHDGYEKYLDPYLTTNRLYHRPYTADQLQKESANKDIITYYTLDNAPWTRTPKPDMKNWRPVSMSKSMYDREKFKEDFREIRVHTTSTWVPGSFRTEIKDNYQGQLRPESQNKKYDEIVKTSYQRSLANLPVNKSSEDLAMRQTYRTENSHYGSARPLCTVIDQHIEKNRRLENRSLRIA